MNFKRLLLTIFIVISLVFSFSISSLAANKSNTSIAVLSYHHIIPGSLPRTATTRAVVSVSEFKAQMKYLYDHGYYTASYHDLVQFLYGKKQLPKKTVVITFDDGYESNYVYAYPVLQRYGFKSIIFPVGSYILDEQIPFDPNKLSILSFDQIKKMSASGLVEFGNHSFDAHKYTGKVPAFLSMGQNQIDMDFKKFETTFEKKDIPIVKAIAYPFGRYNTLLQGSAKKHGYKLGFTIKDGFVNQNSNPLDLNRIVVPPRTDIAGFRQLLRDYSPLMPQGFEKELILEIDSPILYIKGKPVLLDSAPFVYGDTTMVPLRFISEHFGAKVHWNSIGQKIIITSPEIEVVFWSNGSNEVLVNGNRALLPSPALIRQNRIMVPIRFLSETLGFDVKWYDQHRMVGIKEFLD